MAIKDNYCAIKEAAKTLGCTTGRVRQLLGDGAIVGEKVSDEANAPWMVERKSLEKYAKVKPTTGRPRKAAAEAG